MLVLLRFYIGKIMKTYQVKLAEFFSIILLFLFFFYFRHSVIYYFLFTCFGMLIAVRQPSNSTKFVIPLIGILGVLIIGFCAIVGSITTGHLQIYMLMYFSVLVVIYLLDYNHIYKFISTRGKIDIFYIIIALIITISMAYSLINKTSPNFIDEDENFTGIFIFLFFMYSNKKKRFFGILLGILYGLILTRSRSYYLLITLFYSIKFTKYFFNKAIHITKTNHIFYFLLITFVATIILSYIWVFIVAPLGQVEYRAGLNDRSNLIRFVANIKFCDLIRQPNHLLFGGYGKGLREFLQVDEFATASTKFYLGARLVQPHNSIINLMLRIGIIPAITYLVIMSKFISNHMSKENYEYIYPYIINAMFMHSLFTLKWFALWAIVLMIPQQKTIKMIPFNRKTLRRYDK